MLPIKNITPEAFEPYGVVLAHRDQDGGYEKLVIVNSKGWIWALLSMTRDQNPSIESLEQHPHSKESFEPVSGMVVLVVAPPDDPE